MARTLYFVAYDVRRPSRLRLALRVLKDYASGGQKSAFECYLSPGEKKELMDRIQSVLDLTVDAFVVVRMAERRTTAVLGKAIQPLDELYTYIG
jgi:CRISPR-associated protein Cas2